jgi:hypothetical protein
MKPIICGLLCLISSMSSAAAGKDGTMGELTLAIANVAPSGQVTVRITNSSTWPVRIWEESNSWGAAHWRLLLIRNGRLETFFESPDQAFTRNIPVYKEIPVGGGIERRLDLSEEKWRGPDAARIRFVRGDIVIVIYDVSKQFGMATTPSIVESRKMNVWCGVAAAMTVVQ